MRGSRPLLAPVVRLETTGDEHFPLRGTCFPCGVSIVWPVLKCPIPPSKRPLASFECFAPPRPPPSGGLRHGLGPAGCAVLLKARFDRRLDCCPTGDLGGEEGCAAVRASAMLELPLGGGSGERHVQRMPEPRRRDLRTSDFGLSSSGRACHSRMTTALLGEFQNAKRLVSQEAIND